MSIPVFVENDSLGSAPHRGFRATHIATLLCSTRLKSNGDERWGSLLVLWPDELLWARQGRLEIVSGADVKEGGKRCRL